MWLVRMAFWLQHCTPQHQPLAPGGAAAVNSGMQGCNRVATLLWLFYSIPALDDQFCRGCICSTSLCALVLGVQGKGARMPHFHLKVPILTNPLLKTNQPTTSRALGMMLVSGNAPRPSSSGVEQDRHIATAFPYGWTRFHENLPPGSKPHKGVS